MDARHFCSHALYVTVPPAPLRVTVPLTDIHLVRYSDSKIDPREDRCHSTTVGFGQERHVLFCGTDTADPRCDQQALKGASAHHKAKPKSVVRTTASRPEQVQGSQPANNQPVALGGQPREDRERSVKRGVNHGGNTSGSTSMPKNTQTEQSQPSSPVQSPLPPHRHLPSAADSRTRITATDDPGVSLCNQVLRSSSATETFRIAKAPHISISSSTSTRPSSRHVDTHGSFPSSAHPTATLFLPGETRPTELQPHLESRGAEAETIASDKNLETSSSNVAFGHSYIHENRLHHVSRHLIVGRSLSRSRPHRPLTLIHPLSKCKTTVRSSTMDSPSTRQSYSDANTPSKRSSVLSSRASSLRRASAAGTSSTTHSRKSSLVPSHLDDWSDGFTGLVDLDRRMRELAMSERRQSQNLDERGDEEQSDNHDKLLEGSSQDPRMFADKNKTRTLPGSSRSSPRIGPASKLQHHLSSLIHSNGSKSSSSDSLQDKSWSPAVLKPFNRQSHPETSSSHDAQNGLGVTFGDSQNVRERSSSAATGGTGSSILSSPAARSMSSGNSVSTAASSQVSSDLGDGTKSPPLVQSSLLSKRKASSGMGLTGDASVYDTLGPVKLDMIPSSPSPFGHYRLIQDPEDGLLRGWSFAQRETPAFLRFEQEGADPLTPTPRAQPRSVPFDESLLTPNSAAAATWTDPEAPGYFPAGYEKQYKDSAKRNKKRHSSEDVPSPKACHEGSSSESTRDTLRRSAQSLAIGMRLKMLRAKRKLRPDALHA